MESLSHTPIARNADPISSHLAAREITESGVRGNQAQVAFSAVQRHPGLTSFELSNHCWLDRYQAARRLPELQESGLVEKAMIRRCTVSGRPAVTWVVLEKRDLQ